jgi:hypothetical protein
MPERTIAAAGRGSDLVRSKHPSQFVIVPTSVLIRLFVGTPLHRLLPRESAILRFTGRKSGRPLQVELFLHEVEGGLAAFTDAAWRLNFRGGVPVTVVHRGRTLEGTGELVVDQAVVAPRLATAVERKGAYNLGLKVEPKGSRPTVDELAAVGLEMVRFDLP